MNKVNNPMSDEIKLTDKQEMFCLEYLKDLNGTQAAIRAGYSEDSARQIATENLSRPSIENRLQQLMAERTKKVNIEVEDILSDILETRREAAEMQKLNERLKANELLGKYKKMWTDKTELTGKDGGAIEFQDVTDKILAAVPTEVLEASLVENKDNN